MEIGFDCIYGRGRRQSGKPYGFLVYPSLESDYPESLQSLIGESGAILCFGSVPEFPEKLPLKLCGSVSEKGFEVSGCEICFDRKKDLVAFLCTLQGIGKTIAGKVAKTGRFTKEAFMRAGLEEACAEKAATIIRLCLALPPRTDSSFPRRS